MRRTTSGYITKLNAGEIFVFGSNAKGVHGKGAAKQAVDKFGAIYGQARGRQGTSYAIITKKDWRVPKSSTLQDILVEIKSFTIYAAEHTHLTFLVTRVGCDLAGYTEEEIRKLWESIYVPHNVVLPKCFEFRD